MAAEGMTKRTHSLPGTSNDQSLLGTLRGVAENKVGMMGGGPIAESRDLCLISFGEQKVPAAIILKSFTYWSC